MLAKGMPSKQEKDFMLERSVQVSSSSIQSSSDNIQSSELQGNSQVSKRILEVGVAKLRPLTMNTIADTVMHETTVSRAIANKYIRTPHGFCI